jgi:predicted SprT family Zn-dependent metalloprotease
MADLERVRVWADALIALHLDRAQWSFGFDHAKRRAGLCNYTDKRISVSRYLAVRYDDDEIHQVLLHEVAHAIAGPNAGHGAEWKRVAKELGYVGGRLLDGGAAEELAPWRGVCPSGHVHHRYRTPTRIQSCGKCAKGFSKQHTITWERRDGAAQTNRAERR